MKRIIMLLVLSGLIWSAPMQVQAHDNPKVQNDILNFLFWPFKVVIHIVTLPVQWIQGGELAESSKEIEEL